MESGPTMHTIHKVKIVVTTNNTSYHRMKFFHGYLVEVAKVVINLAGNGKASKLRRRRRRGEAKKGGRSHVTTIPMEKLRNGKYKGSTVCIVLQLIK